MMIKGDLRTLLRISLPLIFFLFCEALTLFCERIFLSYYSADSMYSSLNAGYLAMIFQAPCTAIGAMAQVFVGFYQGRGEYKQIGPCVWQLIWFSFASLPITLPLSHVVSLWYFKGTLIEQSGFGYFTILSFGNFLFPLTTTLSSFYLGSGKTLLISSLMIASYMINLILCWPFVFGIQGIFPPLGAKGAALAKCMSLVFLSCSLFLLFLRKKNRDLYATHLWKFSPLALWTYIQPGLVRAFGYLTSKVCWVATCYIMIQKGGTYLDVLTIGGTIITFLVFITNGIYKALLTIASNLIGGGKKQELQKLCFSFLIYIGIMGFFLAIPLIIFPDMLLYFFNFSSQDTMRQIFANINYWILLYIITLTVQMSMCAILISLGELKFQFLCYLILWPIFPVIISLSLGTWNADKLWFIMAVENLFATLLFLVRLRQVLWKGQEKTLLSLSQGSEKLNRH